MIRLLIVMVGWFAASLACQAHRLSDACVRVRVDADAVVVRLDIPIRDLAAVVPLDADGNQVVTWGELRGHRAAIAEHVAERVRFRAPGLGTLRFEPVDLRVADVAGEPCASLSLRRAGSVPDGPLELEYRLLANVDPQHRGLVRWERDGLVRTAVLGPDRPVDRFEVGITPGSAPPTVTDSASAVLGRGFVAEGVHHIWTGYDHLLFLFALLLPAVVRRDMADEGRAGRGGRGDFAAMAWAVLKIVTAFTVAHSITLILAAVKLVRLPAAPVEVAIAASVALAALDNLVPLFRRRSARVAFAFGLIHGFGFAGVLSELDLPAARFVQGVLGFNLGVELGQLAVVLGFLPVAYALRGSWAYRRVALPWGSVAILLVALFWMGERAMAMAASTP